MAGERARIENERTGPDQGVLAAALELVRARMAASPDRLAVFGLCGAQGSGKSTLARAMVAEMAGEGVPAALLSLDDLYLTKAERAELAVRVHPLFATRGVPGTHDVALGLETVAALERGEAAALPRFDKATDDRAPLADWPRAPAGCRLLVLEGWCVGAAAQSRDELLRAVNELEAREDVDGIWRGYANAALAGPYRDLFARLDCLMLLAAPDFSVVAGWRGEQEAALRGRADAPAAMDEAGIARFVQHYERITRHILREMPGRADLTVRLDRERRRAA